MSKNRVLFVDDEPNIRTTLPVILTMHGFNVSTAATVGEALHLMQEKQFDVLLTDLNIGQPGDGFTITSAMRRIQPDALTIIITGFPAFETALQAIREQVDDYVVKPANVTQLVSNIEEKLRNRHPQRPMQMKRVADIFEEQMRDTIDLWIKNVHEDAELRKVTLPRSELRDHLPLVLRELVQTLRTENTELSAEIRKGCFAHGKARRAQGYTLSMLLQEMHLLRRVLFEVIQMNLLAIDISELIPDMLRASDCLFMQMKETVAAFTQQAEPDPTRVNADQAA